MIDPTAAPVRRVPGVDPHPADPASLSRVIAEMYGAAIDPQRWSRALEAICDFVGASQGAIYSHDVKQADVDTLFSFNDDPNYRRLYQETYAPLNPLFPAITFRPVGSVFKASDIIPDKEMEQTKFFREWLAPQALMGSLGLILDKDATRVALMILQWQGHRISVDAEPRMSLLAPHLLQAVAIGRLVVRCRAREAALTEVLDHVGEGAFLLNHDGRIVLANAEGRRLVESGHMLREWKGRLQITSSKADRTLGRHLRTIEQLGTRAAPADLAIPLTEAEGGWTAMVLPLVDGARHRQGETQSAIAALFVRSMSQPGTVSLQAFADKHGLTASEIRVVDATLRLSGLDTIAEALGISRATVKTHLSHVYSKTSLRNQTELIRLVAGFGT